MVKSRDNFISDRACVKVIICYTDGLNFDELKLRLPVGDDDLKTVSRFANEKDKILHLVSAYLKKKYVGKWTVNEFGKPIADGKFFNVSHCKGAVVIALSDSEVGVDIENVRPVNESLINYVADKKETAYIKNDEDFFRLWTAKESLAKAHGKGLIRDVKTIPAFPFDGIKEYCGKRYYTRQFKDGDFIIAVTKIGEEPFKLEIDRDNLI